MTSPLQKVTRITKIDQSDEEVGTKVEHFRAEPELRRAIRAAASEDERSVSDFLRLLVKRAMEARGLLPASRQQRSKNK